MWDSLILQQISNWPEAVYALLFIGMIIEGEGFLLAGIFAAHSGFISMQWVLSIAFIGMFLGDILWYWLGFYFERLLPKKVSENVMVLIDNQLKKRPFTMIIIAKYVYFFHRLLLVRVKPSGISFSRFLKMDLFSIISWIAVSYVLGVAFASSFDLLKQYVKFAEVGLLVAIILVVIAEHFTTKYFRKRIGG